MKSLVTNRAMRLAVFILIFVCVVLVYRYYKFILWTVNQAIDSTENDWANTPSFTLMIRGYSESVMEIYNSFLVGYMLFFPYKKWLNSDVVIVLDDESELDHRLGTVLAHLPPYPIVKYEPKPSEPTFCGEWRREGYSRQQYSNFYSDLFSDRDYIGISDSDMFFITPIAPEDLFVDGKPRIYGYNGCCTRWIESLEEAIGGYTIGEFMFVIGFPIMIKREHFKLMRDHIKNHMKTASFEEAFHRICSKYNERYSQFDMMAHYLWFYHRDDYSWHLNDYNQTNHPWFKSRVSERKEILDKYRPIVGLTKHANHHTFTDYIFKITGDYLCLASQNTAGSCAKYFSPELTQGTLLNLFVDEQYMTANWEKRGMQPNKPNLKDEKPWTNYTQVYKYHMSQVQKRNNAWSFKPTYTN